MNKSKLAAAIALVAIAALHYWSVPRSIWEFDESLFAAAVERYEPLLHHPPPPGYPLYIAFAKIVSLFTPDAFTALLVTSIVTLAAGMLAFVLAFSAIGEAKAAVAATVLLYASPAMLISGTLPQSDSGAMALLALAIWACAKERPAWSGLLCAAAIGWRLQLCIAIVPMFVVMVVLLRSWRHRFIALGTFAIACAAWFVPLVVATEGPASYWEWLSGQARYYAEHDADLSRSGHSIGLIATRFLAHPWGPKWLSLPLLALAATGAFVVRRNRRIIPLAIGSLTYLGFALATMDPADAVRYALPSLPLFALLAGIAVSRVPKTLTRLLASLSILLYAIGAVFYAFPLLHARATTLSPPARAAQWIHANVPGNGIVFFDAPLWPHASYLLRDRRSIRNDAGVAQYGDDIATPIVLLTDGELAHRSDGVTFRWPDTDAYRKLTRGHYGVVSVIPLLPASRFRVIAGVFPPERTRDGQLWRWLTREAIIQLPPLDATRVRLGFRTPAEYPLDVNRIEVNGQLVSLRRNESAEIILPVPGDRRIRIVAERTFIPAQIRGANNRDRRTLSVMLTRVELVDPQPVAAGSPPPQ
ncbi:MAG: hypothetical protein M3P06_09970 [Acidobacteriota bacterium]|nr:hypothetical protein [Acidobacteriota bacterium]